MILCQYLKTKNAKHIISNVIILIGGTKQQRKKGDLYSRKMRKNVSATSWPPAGRPDNVLCEFRKNIQ